MVQTEREALKRALSGLEILSDLEDHQLDWIVDHGEEIHAEANEIVLNEGDPADSLFFILGGDIRFQRESVGDAPVNIGGRGQVGGKLPFSRMKTYPGTIRAVTPLWSVRIWERDFEEMLRLIPPLNQRLVSLMADRIRETTKNEQQHDKLRSLGKLSAGLAHEINNPAAAAKRATASLREVMNRLRDANTELDKFSLTPAQRERIAFIEQNASHRMEKACSMTPLELSDLEQELGDWLSEKKISNAWDLAPHIAEAAVTTTELQALADQFECAALGPVLTRISCTVSADRLISELSHSLDRITDLVKAIKEYSYMDQAPQQEVDIHDGLESTLTMLAFKLRKHNIDVKRNFDHKLPRVCAYGRELNQVWTNLIDNAVDAMAKGGKLLLTTRQDGQGILVDVQDSGSGVPEEIQQRIFDPFFTTKPVGEGTGLGLDTVMRIVRKHRGDIQLDSKPGETHFKIYLPAAIPPAVTKKD